MGYRRSIVIISLSIPWIGTAAAIPGLGDPQLSLLLEQGSREIAEIRKLVVSSQFTAEEMRRATARLEELTAGIDRALAPFLDTHEFHEAILKVQRQEGYATALIDPFLDKNKTAPAEAEFERHRALQTSVTEANAADLRNIRELDRRLNRAQAGELARLSAEMLSKNWETNLRISTQLTELVRELRALREESAARRKKEEAIEQETDRLLQEALSFTPRGSEAP